MGKTNTKEATNFPHENLGNQIRQLPTPLDVIVECFHVHSMCLSFNVPSIQLLHKQLVRSQWDIQNDIINRTWKNNNTNHKTAQDNHKSKRSSSNNHHNNNDGTNYQFRFQINISKRPGPEINIPILKSPKGRGWRRMLLKIPRLM